MCEIKSVGISSTAWVILQAGFDHQGISESLELD